MTRLAFIVFLIAVVHAQDKIDNSGKRIRNAAIGDSYSIGEGASPNESWPAVLTRHLNEKGLHAELVANPSITGWTSPQAIDPGLPLFLKEKPNFRTLLSGVYGWGLGGEAEQCRK